MKIVTVLGARPQFIKAGSLSRKISKTDKIEEIIIHTGQHYDKNMSDIFFNELKIPKPNYNLEITKKNHGEMTGKMIIEIEKILLSVKPEWVVVYGDTNSTLAGAIAASKLNIKIAHIESGLRSKNMKMPEEINRILTDRISSLLLCPTKKAIDNLLNEGFDKFPSMITNVGDIMLDSARFYSNISIKPDIDFDDNCEYLLCTLHRAENTNNLERLLSIINAINVISKEIQVVIPLHPRTKSIIEKNNIKIDFTISPPVSYLQMIYLIQHSKMIITDSGGLQKESFFFKKNCIVIRDETEWTELIEHNYNYLVGADYNKIIDTYKTHEFNQDFSTKFYGIGNTSQDIIDTIFNFDQIIE